MDVTVPDQIEKAVQLVNEIVGDKGLHVLFNNAGVVPVMMNLEFSPMNYYRDTMEVNYFGVVNVTKAFLPLVRKAKGKIFELF